MVKKRVCVVGYGQHLRNVLSALDFNKVEVKSIVTIDRSFFRNISVEDVEQIICEYNLNCCIYLIEDLKNCVLQYNVDYYILSNGNDITIKNLLKKYLVRDSRILWGGILSDTNMYKYLNKIKYVIHNDIKLDFFSTGISYTKCGLDLPSLLPYKGMLFSEQSQDLFYAYEIAKYILSFNCKFKFILIGLAPYQFYYDMSLSKLYCDMQLQYYPIINKFNNNYAKGEIAEFLFGDSYKKIYSSISSELEVELNDCDGYKFAREKLYPSISQLASAEVEALELSQKDYPLTLKQNLQIMKQYINLCKNNNIIPIGVVFPFSDALYKHYPKEDLKEFNTILNNLYEEYSFNTINLFDLRLDYSHFSDCSHLNNKGAKVVSKIIKNEMDKLLLGI